MPLFPYLLALQIFSPATPPADTSAYWQQRADYTIVAVLDERAHVVNAAARLQYTNNSPDTLREFYLHQHLNAFRPHSAWAAEDIREKRKRFQKLKEPNYAYERFTAPVTINGIPVTVEYPGAPDSTVARFTLPAPLPPGESLSITFQWQARASTFPRRQGREGRSYDFAQWYPKVAVYDKKGWRFNPFRPAGELYGEFGTFDVTLIVPADQVVGATGVVVDGDSGWERVRRWGKVYDNASRAYQDIPPAPPTTVTQGYKRLRVVARNTHHFAWSVSPRFVYEGGVHVRRAGSAGLPFSVYDSVPVHILYRRDRAKTDSTWGNGLAVQRTLTAMQWLDSTIGPYAYPQLTNLQRVEKSGGTEFPMLIMDADASQSLILHEVSHIYAYGVLANNEWESAWMDEGFVSYLTAWGMVSLGLRKPPPVRPDTLPVWPLAKPADQYPTYRTFQIAAYIHGSRMFSQLHEILGDDKFRTFLRTYYARWGFKHVDERALTSTAEDVYGSTLAWFFEPWMRGNGCADARCGRTE